MVLDAIGLLTNAVKGIAQSTGSSTTQYSKHKLVSKKTTTGTGPAGGRRQVPGVPRPTSGASSKGNSSARSELSDSWHEAEAGWQSPVDVLPPPRNAKSTNARKTNTNAKGEKHTQSQMATPLPALSQAQLAQQQQQQQQQQAQQMQVQMQMQMQQQQQQRLPNVPEAAAMMQQNAHEQQRLASLVAEYEAAISGLQADRASLQSEVQRVLQAEQARASALSRLQEERDALATENARQSEALTTLQKKKTKGGGDASAASSAELEQAREQIQALTGEVEQLKQEQSNQVTHGISAEGQQQVATLNREMRALRGEVARAESMLAEANTASRAPPSSDESNNAASKQVMAEFRAEMMQQLNSLREEKEAMRSLMARREASVESAVSTASASASLELARVKSELNAEREKSSRLTDDLARVRESANRDLERVTHALKDTSSSKVASLELSHQSAMETLTQKNQTLEGEKRDMLEKFEAMNEEIAKVRTSFRDMKKEWDAEAEEKLSRECERRLSAEQALTSERAKADGYLSQIEQLRSQISEQNKLLTTLQAAQSDLQKQCIDASSNEVKSSKLVQELEYDVKELKREKGALEKRLEEAQFANDELSANLDMAKEEGDKSAARAKRAETDTREAAHREQRDYVAAVQAELASVHAELASARQFIQHTFVDEYQATVSGAVRLCKSETSELRAELQRMEADASAVSEQYRKSRSDSDMKHREAYAKVETENGKLTLRARELSERLAEAEREVTSVKSMVDSLTAEKKALLGELEGKDGAIAGERKTFETKRRALMSEKEELERQVYALTKEHESTTAKFRQERAEWSDKVRSATLSGARENQELRERVADLENSCSTLESAKRNLERKLSEAERHLEGARENVRNKEALLWGTSMGGGNGNTRADSATPYRGANGPTPSPAAVTFPGSAGSVGGSAILKPAEKEIAEAAAGGAAVALGERGGSSTNATLETSAGSVAAATPMLGAVERLPLPHVHKPPEEGATPGTVSTIGVPTPSSSLPPESAAAGEQPPATTAWATPTTSSAEEQHTQPSAYEKYLDAHARSGAPPLPSDLPKPPSSSSQPPPPLSSLPPRQPTDVGMMPASSMPPTSSMPATSSPAVMAALLSAGRGGGVPPTSTPSTSGAGNFNITSYQRSLQMQLHAAMGTTPTSSGGMDMPMPSSSDGATQFRQLGASSLPPTAPSNLRSAGLPVHPGVGGV